MTHYSYGTAVTGYNLTQSRCPTVVDNVELSRKLKLTDKKSQFRSSTFQGKQWIEYCLPQLAERIEAVRTETKRSPVYVSFVEELSSDTMALIVLVVCLDNLIEPKSVTPVAYQIGDYLQLEVNYDFYEQRCEGFLNAMMKRWPAMHRSKRAIKYGHEVGIFDTDEPDDLEHASWTHEQKVQIGRVYVECLLDLGFLEKIPTRSALLLKWSDEVLEWAVDTFEHWHYFNPAWTPLTTIPQSYVETIKGSKNFSYQGLPPVSFRLDSALCSRHTATKLENGSNLLAADKLSKVAYKLNDDVHSVVRYLFDNEIPIGSLGTCSPTPLPQEVPGASDELKAELKREMHFIHLKNSRSASRRLYMMRSMNVLDEYKDEDFYFLWQADSRGRLYPMTSCLLNPQGDDLSKSLLMFSEGKKLGERGLSHLMVEVANRYGEDKESWDDRRQWTADNLPMIRQVAYEPIANRHLWSECDSPFMFLAACIELTAALDSDDPTQYVSHLPCYYDGKCSGIQHYSSLMKDEVGGEMVGLTPLASSEKPRDIYTEVMIELIKFLHEHKGELAEAYELVPKFNRKLTKRPTMTYCYSATQRSASKHTFEWFSDNGIEEPFSTAVDIAKVTYKEVLPKKLSGTVQAMKWLVKSARIITKTQDEGIHWHSPSGFEVHQRYIKQKSMSVRVKCKAMGLDTAVKMRYTPEDPEVDKTKQSGAIAPNFIHSFDSAHLCSTVLAFNHGITVIHDSFGCHASDADELYTVLRDTLRDQYIDLTLDDYKREWEMRYLVDLPPTPETGSLDLNDVHKFTYAFL